MTEETTHHCHYNHQQYIGTKLINQVYSVSQKSSHFSIETWLP